MKRIYIAILAATTLFAACEEFQPVFTGQYPDPQEQYIYNDADFGTLTTIADLKDMYKANGSKPFVVQKTCVIKGQVTTSDQVGNLYKSLYIQDETAGIEIKIGRNGLYNEYKLGQWLYVDCMGLTVGDYRGMINLGYSDPSGEYETAYLEHAYIIDAHIFKGTYDKPVEPVVITEADLHKKENLGRLVTIKDLKYNDEIFLLAYINYNGDRKDYSGNGIFISKDDDPKDDYLGYINNKRVVTWAASEQLWKEYLYSGIFDEVKAGIGTVASYKEEVMDPVTGKNKIVYNISNSAYPISQYFMMGETEVQVRSSGYARFSDTKIPQEVVDGTATVTFTGILTEYKGEAQFTLIDLDGVTKADGTKWY